MHVDDHNKFDEIPVGVDVLVTHGAAYGKLDFCDLRSCLPPNSYATDLHNHARRYSLGEVEPPVLQRKGSRELVKAIARIRPGKPCLLLLNLSPLELQNNDGMSSPT